MNDKYWVSQAMQTYGGSFVRKLGELYLLADATNTHKLEEVFKGYFEEYQQWARKLKSENEREQNGK